MRSQQLGLGPAPQLRVVVAWLWLCCALFSVGATGQEATTTTVSVYLPGYENADWSALRGSIVNSDDSATTYTVFCAEQAPTCEISGDLPFVFAEGPNTLNYGGSAAGTITADLHCDLAGKTAATCTGSSSFGPSYRQGSITGPTQTVWTKTFAGAEVTWGVLTLSTPGSSPTVISASPTAGSASSNPAVKSNAGRLAERRNWILLGPVGAVFLAMFML
ncbi:hypothetical protein QBC46DRAFT_386971 [Diplogelasinospora grovesii]|uniref:Uncharacterized protein n=1 Tax=Diplogelasinospora grovesii TaxID=303347 RepID=A0AAN6S4R4_9PEZI|nr:hypothetical protein QBC46DRAFT_386971 [Diplogelasinospora grovesii]